MKSRHGLGAVLVTVALAPFAAFATGACGGKVLSETQDEGTGTAVPDAGPVGTASGSATGSTTASSPPTSTATATTTATGTTTATSTGTAPTSTTTATSPPAGSGYPFDGGVFNDGRPGSLVSIVKTTACTIPSAVSHLEQVAPVTVARVLAFCGPSRHFIQCASEDGVQCSDPSVDNLLFDMTCIDQCAADEYVVEVDDPAGGGGVPVPASCRIPAGAPGFPSYCCACAN